MTRRPYSVGAIALPVALLAVALRGGVSVAEPTPGATVTNHKPYAISIRDLRPNADDGLYRPAVRDGRIEVVLEWAMDLLPDRQPSQYRLRAELRHAESCCGDDAPAGPVAEWTSETFEAGGGYRDAEFQPVSLPAPAGRYQLRYGIEQFDRRVAVVRQDGTVGDLEETWHPVARKTIGVLVE